MAFAFDSGQVATLSIAGVDISGAVESVKLGRKAKSEMHHVIGSNPVVTLVHSPEFTLTISGLIDATVASLFTSNLGPPAPVLACVYEPQGRCVRDRLRRRHRWRQDGHVCRHHGRQWRDHRRLMPKASPAVDTSELLTLEQIDAADDRLEIVLPVPQWHGSVRIRGLSYDQLSACRQRAWDSRKKETNEDVLNAWCLSLGMVSPTVSFAKAKVWICDRAFGPVNSILSEILTASGLGARAVAEAKSEPDPEQPEPAR